MPYIAMAGLHGYLPNYVQEHETHQDAVEDLTHIHELNPDEISWLQKGSYLELNLETHGNAYCEITESVE